MATRRALKTGCSPTALLSQDDGVQEQKPSPAPPPELAPTAAPTPLPSPAPHNLILEAEGVGGSQAPPLDRFIRERECRALTGLSRTTRWRLERAGRFPRRHRISPNAVGWLESEIDDWIASRVTAQGSVISSPAA